MLLSLGLTRLLIPIKSWLNRWTGSVARYTRNELSDCLYVYLIDVIVVERIVRLFLSTFSAKNTKQTVSSLSCSWAVDLQLKQQSSAGEQRDVSLLWFVYFYLLYSLNPCRVYHSTLSVFCFFLRYYLRLVRCFFSCRAEDELLVGSFRTTRGSSQAGRRNEV